MTELVERSAAVVRRYGGTVEHTGDGVMAIFGAPVALEDHAVRACLAAMNLQDEANRLAAEVARRDGVALLLRVGLNSGRVIAGEIGSGSLGYAAGLGQQVGMAQRMESAAPPGRGVLSESTAAAGRTHPRCWPTRSGCASRAPTTRCPRAGCWQSSRAMTWSGAPNPASSAGTVRWPPSRLWWRARTNGRGGVVNVEGPPGIGNNPGWPGRPRRWRPVAASRWSGPSASHTPATFRSVW